jgi:hypothetical protein
MPRLTRRRFRPSAKYQAGYAASGTSRAQNGADTAHPDSGPRIQANENPMNRQRDGAALIKRAELVGKGS